VSVVCRRTPAPMVPTTPASLSRYCLVDVDSFPSPFSGELFGGNLVSLDPLTLPPPSASSSLTPFQISVESAVGPQRDGGSRLLTLAAAGLSPRATATTTAATAQMVVASNTDNEVSSSCISASGVDHRPHGHDGGDELDIARYVLSNRPIRIFTCKREILRFFFKKHAKKFCPQSSKITS